MAVSDILIRGMDMPNSCDGCPLVEEVENFYGDTMSKECILIYNGYISEAPKGGRRLDCPLVPIPEGHGRLIDADALIRDKSSEATLWCGYEYQDHPIVFEEDILAAPTIVPAEGGGEDGN